MSAIIENIILQKGEDYEVVGEVQDDFDNPLDISGATFRAQVRDFCGVGSTLLASFTFTIFLDTSVTPNVYKYRRTMAQTIINAITQESGVWDQFMESSTGESLKMFEGKVKIKCNVTDPTV